MADINPITDRPVQGVTLITWEQINNNDTGIGQLVAGTEPLAASFQAVGTFNSATVVLQGSNDNTNWATVKDFTGADISLTATGLVELSTTSLYLRPSISGGGGSQDIDCFLVLRGA